MNVNLFQMFAGPKMPQGDMLTSTSAPQADQAAGTFAGLLQALLFGNATDTQMMNGQQTGFADLFGDGDNASAPAIQMITDSLRDGILSQQELMNIIQTTLEQFPLLSDGFASKLGDIFSSAIPSEEADALLARLKLMVNENNNTPQSLTKSGLFVNELNESAFPGAPKSTDNKNITPENADKSALLKTEAQPNNVLSAASAKGLSPEELIEQIASKVAAHKNQNQGASLEGPAKIALAQSTGEEIFGQLVSRVAKSAEHGMDEAADSSKQVVDTKLSAAAGGATNINAANSPTAVKETIHVSKIFEIDQMIAKMANSGQQRLVLRIDPPDLGSIQIRLILDNGVIRADFRVDNQSVKDSFNFAMPQIKTSLEDAGIKTGEFFVDLKEDYYSDRKQGQERSGQNKNENRQKTDNSFFELFA